MLSRVAESIYWMARYVERAENTARFIDVTLNQILDQPNRMAPQWEPMVNTTGDHEFFEEHYEAPTAENVIRFLTTDTSYPNSIISSLRAARENARTVRESISSEAWEQLNEFYHYVNTAVKETPLVESSSEFFRNVKQYSHLFQGIMDATLSRGAGWHFANLGRMVERADKTSRILDVKYFTLLPSPSDVGSPIDDLGWSAVLRSVSGLEMYRKRFRSMNIHRVVEFLVLDREFPRAVHFCLSAGDWSLHEITGSPIGAYRNSVERQLGSLKAELAYAEVDAIINSGLHEFIDGLQNKLNSIGGAIHDVFFAMRPVEPQGIWSQSQSQG